MAFLSFKSVSKISLYAKKLILHGVLITWPALRKLAWKSRKLSTPPRHPYFLNITKFSTQFQTSQKSQESLTSSQSHRINFPEKLLPIHTCQVLSCLAVTSENLNLMETFQSERISNAFAFQEIYWIKIGSHFSEIKGRIFEWNGNFIFGFPKNFIYFRVVSEEFGGILGDRNSLKIGGFFGFLETNLGCLRNILGIWWPQIISNEELWEKTGHSKIDVEIKRRKCGWIEHTLRKSQNEICHSVLEWNPQGRRSRGRPKATWRRTVLAECGKTSFGELRAQARNRHRWNLKADGQCSTGVWL
jgi:hypothetical protein